jgi:hypothetical protein
MKRYLQWLLIVGGASLADPVSAETWNCIFPGLISKMNVRERMEINDKEIVRDGDMIYRIVENNQRAVVATHSRTLPLDSSMIVGTLAIEKTTGDFVIGVMVPGQPVANKTVTGKCQKE